MFEHHYKIESFCVSFKAFTAVTFQVKVFWVVTPYSIVVRHQYPTTTLHGVTTQKNLTWRILLRLCLPTCLFLVFLS